jgi:hypothetical protein
MNENAWGQAHEQARAAIGAHPADRLYETTDLQVSYSDIRESLALILAVTTDPQEILTSLDDAVANNVGD